MLKELLREESLEVYLNYFEMDRKKFKILRFVYAILLFFAYAMAVILIKNNMLFLGLPVVAFIGYKIPVLGLLMRKNKSDLINSYLFPEFLQSFMALQSSTDNVYQTLKATLPYMRDPLKSELENLVRKIEVQNRREDYLAFADYIGTSEAYMVMDMIYQFSVYGSKPESLKKLEDYISDLNKNKVEELIVTKMSEMDKFAAIPIFISVFLIGGFALIVFISVYIRDISGVINFA